ncbi:MAG: hypothetical protein RLZZ69_1823 [Cyanobacteriota bacterium]|jgi:hypothetical protein
MIINDLEFFSSCDRESQKNGVAVRGGGSSSSTSSCYSVNGETYGTVTVSNDDGSYSLEIVGDEIVNKKGKGKGKVSYKLGGHHYSAYYEVSGYGAVNAGCTIH